MADLPASESSSIEQPLADLIHGYLDGELSAGQVQVLGQRLAESPADARQFARIALLHSRMQEALTVEAALEAPAAAPAAGTLPVNRLPQDTLPPRSPLPETAVRPAGAGTGSSTVAPRPAVQSTAAGRTRRRALIASLTGLCGALLVLPGIWWWSASSGESSVGVLTGLEGTLRIERPGAGSRPATVGMELLPGDRLVGSSFDCSGVMRLQDGSLVTLPGRSVIVCSPTGDGGQTLLVESGSMLAAVRPRDSARPLLIRTAHAIVRVVGTEFSVSTDETRTEVQVRQGAVQVSAASGGEAVEVGAGEQAVAGQAGRLTVSPLKSLPASWEEDFEAGRPEGWHGDFVSAAANQSLPGSSRGAIRAAFIDRFSGHYLAGVQAVDERGLFRITPSTHIHITFSVGHSEPDWLNFFVAALPGGDAASRRNFKCTVLSDTRPLPGQWRTVTIPLTMFHSWRESDGKAIDWSGPSPAPEDILTTLWAGSPPPDRGLIIDRIRVTPDGPGRVTMQDVEPD